MAKSGTVTTSSCEGRSMTLSWSATQSTTNNTSTISWSLYGSGSYTGWVKCGGFYVAIDGNVVCNWSTDSRVQVQPGATVASGSITLAHNSNGTKSFSISVQAGIYEYARNCSGSGTFTLNTIPRASSISVSGAFTMGSSKNISVSKASSGFTHTITYLFGSMSGTICTKSSSTSVAWSPPENLASQVPNTTSGRGTLTCYTYNGSTQVGTSSISFDCNVPASIVPNISAIIENTNNTFGCYAQNLSAVKVTPTASGVYGSTIKIINITATGVTSKTASSGSSYTLDVFPTSGDKTITVTATDSRGRSSSWTQSITVKTYTLPVANIAASRGSGSTVSTFVADDTGSYAKITATGSVCNISGNTITTLLQYKPSTSETWTTISTTPSGLSLNSESVVAATDTATYNIKITITDKAGKQAVAQMSLSNAYATMDFLNGGNGIAFGKTASKYGVDCAMQLFLSPGKSNTKGGSLHLLSIDDSGAELNAGTLTATSNVITLENSSDGAVSIIGKRILLNFDDDLYANSDPFKEYVYDRISKDQYQHAFDMGITTRAASSWQDITHDTVEINVTEGTYLVNVTCTISGSSTTMGMATIRWLNSDSSEPDNMLSRQTVPIVSSLLSTFNFTWVCQTSKFTGHPQVYANQTFSMRSCVVTLTRIGNTFTSV